MKSFAIGIGVLLLAVGAFAIYANFVANPATARELRQHPQGERAQVVMLLQLPSGKEIPVNYLREDNLVFVGADFPWWRELDGVGGPVEMLIKGESIRGHGRVVQDDPEYTVEVFQRLRPTSYEILSGKLVVIEIDPAKISDRL